jgi:hypothetical protein
MRYLLPGLQRALIQRAREQNAHRRVAAHAHHARRRAAIKVARVRRVARVVRVSVRIASGAIAGMVDGRQR